jgi:hypothetical protein
MWRDYMVMFDPEAVCNPPATADQLAQLEAILSVTLPGELTALLREMNGAEVGYVSIVWSTDEIAQRNLDLRRQLKQGSPQGSDLAVDHLLCFGDCGNGDLYGFPITPEGVRNEVFLWDHEDDRVSYQASSLREMLDANG